MAADGRDVLDSSLRTAIHELGHAVVGLDKGCTITSIRVYPAHYSLGDVPGVTCKIGALTLDDLLVYIVAGRAAECAFLPKREFPDLPELERLGVRDVLELKYDTLHPDDERHDDQDEVRAVKVAKAILSARRSEAHDDCIAEFPMSEVWDLIGEACTKADKIINQRYRDLFERLREDGAFVVDGKAKWTIEGDEVTAYLGERRIDGRPEL